MSVSAIPSTTAGTITSAAATLVQQASSSTSSLSSALQEASETPATTALEAAKGDPVAKRLLAREQQEKESLNSAPTSEPGKGEAVDKRA